MRRNPHGRILKGKPKKQHLSTIPKSCSYCIYVFDLSYDVKETKYKNKFCQK